MHIQNHDITPATSQNHIRHPIANKLYTPHRIVTKMSTVNGSSSGVHNYKHKTL